VPGGRRRRRHRRRDHCPRDDVAALVVDMYRGWTGDVPVNNVSEGDIKKRTRRTWSCCSNGEFSHKTLHPTVSRPPRYTSTLKPPVIPSRLRFRSVSDPISGVTRVFKVWSYGRGESSAGNRQRCLVLVAVVSRLATLCGRGGGNWSVRSVEDTSNSSWVART